MRNYFKLLAIPSVAKREEIAHALRPESDIAQTLSEKHQSDAQEILMHDKRRQVYTNNVNFFHTLYEAKHCLTSPLGIDTHQWDYRLEEFHSSEQESQADLQSVKLSNDHGITYALDD